MLSLGGSILLKDDSDPDFIRGFIALIRELSGNNKFIIVTGGGRTARDFINIGRELGTDEAALDSLGIEATRLNSWLVLGAMGDAAYPRPFTSIEEAILGASTHGVAVGGGTHPGHTTDAVSALIAERWGADLFLNLTAVKGAYTSDPNEDPDAAWIPKMTSGELVELVSKTSRGAGSHSVLDPLAAAIVHRAGIRTGILNGRNLKALGSALTGRGFEGTIIESSKGGA
ncbi:MAG: UMP kinase [Thermoplasmatota archaeon]